MSWEPASRQLPLAAVGVLLRLPSKCFRVFLGREIGAANAGLISSRQSMHAVR